MTDTIKMPDGRSVYVTRGDPKTLQSLIDDRHAIAMQHCRNKGWPEDPEQLTWEQIIEIRALPEWQNAGRQ